MAEKRKIEKEEMAKVQKTEKEAKNIFKAKSEHIYKNPLYTTPHD